MKSSFYLLSFALFTGIIASSCGNSESDASNDLLAAEFTTSQNETVNSSAKDNSGFTDSKIPAGMEVIFEDDFINESGIPDPSKWSLCEKTNADWARYLSGSYDQAYTQDGYLYLIGEQKDGEYLTGGIETRGKFDFEHGVVECRARFKSMPMGGHTGIWMMPSPPAEQWPKSGEIDIMEHLNKEGIIYETVHSWYADDMGHSEDPKAQHTVAVDKDDWNIYGVEWTSEKITFTVNGEKYLEYPNLHLDGEDGEYQWPFNHSFYLILSQSLGGEGTGAGPITDSELPAIFEIDWIRVFQSEDTTSVPMITAD